MVTTSSRRLPALYAAVGAGTGTLLPYLVLYLTARGLTATGAGLVIGLMSGVGVVVIPLWGRLADGRLGLVRTLRLSLVLAAIAALALLAAGRTVPAIVVCALLLAAARAPHEALSDALTVDVLGDTADYGRIRMWASIGFAVAVGVWGWALGHTGLGLILLAYPAALLAAALSTRGVFTTSVASLPGPAATQARGQALLQTLLMGVGPVAGAPLGGLGYTHLAPPLLFGVAAAAALLGALAAAGPASAGTPRGGPPEGTASRASGRKRRTGRAG